MLSVTIIRVPCIVLVYVLRRAFVAQTDPTSSTVDLAVLSVCANCSFVCKTVNPRPVKCAFQFYKFRTVILGYIDFSK